MDSKIIYWPSINNIGPNSLKLIGAQINELGYKNALIITDKVLIQLGIVEAITNILDNISVNYHIYDESHTNPTTENVDHALALYQSAHCDCIIAIGSNSVHNITKSVSILATNGGDLREYHGVDKSLKKGAPIIAINTTAGIATETMASCTIIDKETQKKMVILDKHCLPLISVNDPLLMLYLPRNLTVSTGIEVLTCAVEAYLASEPDGEGDEIALDAIRLIAEFLEKTAQHGDDINLRNKMAYASYIAGLSHALNNSGFGYIEAMSHQLQGKYDLPYGICNAMLLPAVMNYSTAHSGDKLRKIAEIFGFPVRDISTDEADQKAITGVRQLCEKLGAPRGLKEVGVTKEDIRELAKGAVQYTLPSSTIKPLSLKEMMKLYRQAL